MSVWISLCKVESYWPTFPLIWPGLKLYYVTEPAPSYFDGWPRPWHFPGRRPLWHAGNDPVPVDCFSCTPDVQQTIQTVVQVIQKTFTGSFPRRKKQQNWTTLFYQAQLHKPLTQPTFFQDNNSKICSMILCYLEYYVSRITKHHFHFEQIFRLYQHNNITVKSIYINPITLQ